MAIPLLFDSSPRRDVRDLHDEAFPTQARRGGRSQIPLLLQVQQLGKSNKLDYRVKLMAYSEWAA